jgi:hypothetical protein
MDCDPNQEEIREVIRQNPSISPPQGPRVVRLTKRWEGNSPDWGHQHFEQEATFNFDWADPIFPTASPPVPTTSPEMGAVIAEIQERVMQNEAKTGALESRMEQMKNFAAYILEWVSNLAKGVTETHKMMNLEHLWTEGHLLGVEGGLEEVRKKGWGISRRNRGKFGPGRRGSQKFGSAVQSVATTSRASREQPHVVGKGHSRG